MHGCGLCRYSRNGCLGCCERKYKAYLRRNPKKQFVERWKRHWGAKRAKRTCLKTVAKVKQTANAIDISSLKERLPDILASNKAVRNALLSTPQVHSDPALKKTILALGMKKDNGDGEVELPGANAEVTPKAVLRALQRMSWPELTAKRRNISHVPVKSFTLGYIRQRSKAGFTKEFCTRPRLLQLCMQLLKSAKQNGEVDQHFECSAIQVNGSHASMLHTDANNDGDSYAIAIGDDFTGGRLFVADDTGPAQMKVQRKMRGCPKLKPGHIIKGRTVNIKNTFERFNGQRPHAVMPFRGQRFSLIFFKDMACRKMAAKDRAVLRKWGMLT